jgi:hypothetical protein
MPDETTGFDRIDNGVETSINWEDDATVIKKTLAHPSAQHGCVRVLRDHVASVARITKVAPNCLTTERRPVEGNPHHGNIVFTPRSLPRGIVKMVANALAMGVVEFVPRSTPNA